MKFNSASISIALDFFTRRKFRLQRNPGGDLPSGERCWKVFLCTMTTDRVYIGLIWEDDFHRKAVL